MNLSNREISRMFSLYAELLLLHGVNNKLSSLLSGASYRLTRLNKEIADMAINDLNNLFNPVLLTIIKEIKKSRTISKLDELIELTPGGLFEMMQLKGLGGKKLSVLWKVAGIDSMESLLKACEEGKIAAIKGFGSKTETNIIKAIENYNSNTGRFHYAAVADQATKLIRALQAFFSSKLISLCGEIRRKSTTVSGIEIVAAVDLKKIRSKGSQEIIDHNVNK